METILGHIIEKEIGVPTAALFKMYSRNLPASSRIFPKLQFKIATPGSSEHMIELIVQHSKVEIIFGFLDKSI